MKEFYAIEYVDNIPLAVNIFPAAQEGTNDYRALVSLGAFEKQMCKDCQSDPNARRFWLQPKFSWALLIATDNRMARPLFSTLPTVNHDDLWSFYRAINWDYKKKKFI